MGSMIWNAIIDHIPLWVWLVISFGGVGALLYFFSPILIPIWRMLPTPVKGVLIALATGLLAYLGGRYKGRANAEEQERRRNAEAQQKRVEVDRDVAGKTGTQVDKDLRDRWSRD